MQRFSDHWAAEHDARWPAQQWLAGAPPTTPSSVATPPASAAPSSPKPPDEARGKALVLRFNTQRCIHSRHCVLGEPKVFLANTPGDWLYPDEAAPERIAIVAHNCPSGAITCQRLDGGPDETAPLVNVARLHENGPLAPHAELHITGHADPGASAFRATLCRCGQSQNKAFCEGTHAVVGFVAAGV